MNHEIDHSILLTTLPNSEKGDLSFYLNVIGKNIQNFQSNEEFRTHQTAHPQVAVSFIYRFLGEIPIVEEILFFFNDQPYRGIKLINTSSTKLVCVSEILVLNEGIFLDVDLYARNTEGELEKVVNLRKSGDSDYECKTSETYSVILTSNLVEAILIATKYTEEFFEEF